MPIILCTFASKLNIITIMVHLINYITNGSDFDEFRLWFNRNFKVSIGGKFKGCSLIPRNVLYKLFKALSSRFRKQYDYILIFRSKGITYKFYSI